MSYGQQNRTTESWNNSDSSQDPNAYGSSGGRDNLGQQDNFGQQGRQGSDWQSQQGQGQQGFQGQGQQGYQGQQSQQGFQGSGAQVPGSQWSAGDDLSNTGAAGGYDSGYQGGTDTTGGGNLYGSQRSQGQGGFQSQQGTQQGTDYDQDDDDVGRGQNKPSLGDRVKGTAEKMTGRMTGNTGMKERGQERKQQGDF